MAQKKSTQQEVKKLQKQIDEYEAKPIQANERPLKLTMPFTEAVDKIVRAPKPPKKRQE